MLHCDLTLTTKTIIKCRKILHLCHKYFIKLEKKTTFTICILEIRVHWCIIVFNPVVIIFQKIKKGNDLLRLQLINIINGSKHVNYTANCQMSESRQQQILPNVHTTKSISYSPHPSTSMPLNRLGCERVELSRTCGEVHVTRKLYYRLFLLRFPVDKFFSIVGEKFKIYI